MSYFAVAGSKARRLLDAARPVRAFARSASTSCTYAFTSPACKVELKLLLCGAPHKRYYAESIVMRSRETGERAFRRKRGRQVAGQLHIIVPLLRDRHVGGP